ncbi:MAG: hypothetical protein JW807_13650 [Spirochaetes bacterium]|nr:hypothetical protein [Spirochaetota bacterium]
MIVVLLFIILFVSIAFHISYLTKYIQTREQQYLQRYVVTTVGNVVLSGALIFVALYQPEEIQKIKFPLLMWIIMGFIMVSTLMAQVTIFRRVYTRSKLPEHYHYNFFGKKVLHATVLKMPEVVLFFATIPAFLLAGAYFIAKLIRFFL